MQRLYEFINLFWKHIKKHYEIDVVHGSQEQIEILMADTEIIASKYIMDPVELKFVKTCLVAFLTYLEEKNGSYSNK